MALADIYQKATLVQIPSGYKAADAELYSVVPNTTAGDFTVSVDADATRVNKDGLVESVAANQARLDYNPTNLQDPTLLLEPQRTNDTTHSEDFTQTSYWNNVIDVVATTNQTTAPDGSNTGNKIQANSGTNFKILRKGAFTIPSGITMSMFVKRGNHDYITFKAQGDFNFNLSTLTWGGSYSNVGYELYPNDWVRLHHTTTSSSTSYFGIYLTDSSFNQSWNATGDEFVYVWGAQYETGTYPTSYIPTSGGTGTRTQDRCIEGGNDALFNDSEGVLFADLEALGDGTTARKISLSDGSTDFVSIEFTTVAGVIAFSAGSTNNTFFSSVAVSGQTPKNRNKIAIKYKSGNTDCFINGTKVLTRTEAFTLSGLDRVNFENRATSGSQNMFAKIHQLMVFNEALTDAELTTLTT
jgi:hypothetical protein